MKKLLPFLLIAFLILPAQTAFGSALLFKTSKILTENGLQEIANFDTANYKQIRLIIVTDAKKPENKAQLQAVLNLAKRSLERAETNLSQGLISRAAYDEAKKEVARAQTAFDNSPNENETGLFFKDGAETLFFDDLIFNKSMLIETPPQKISVKVFGKGFYKVFVWAR